MSVSDQDTVVLCHCHAQLSIGGTCPQCGDTVSFDDQSGNSPPSENQPMSLTRSELIDPPGPLIGPNEDPSFKTEPMDQSGRSQHGDGRTMSSSSFTRVEAPSEMLESYVNVEEPSLTPFLRDSQSRTESANTPEARRSQDLRPRMTNNMNPPRMANPSQHGNPRSPNNMQNPNMVRPPFNQTQMPNPTMQQGYPQFYAQPQGMPNFNQNNQYMPYGPPQTHSGYNPYLGQPQSPPSFNPNYQSQPHGSPNPNFNPNLPGQPLSPPSSDPNYPSRAQTPSGHPRGPPGIDTSNQGQAFGPGYPVNPMMKPGFMPDSFGMPSQGGPHSSASSFGSTASQNADSSMSSSVYSQQSMMGSQMMPPYMIILQQKTQLDQKIFGYQQISQQRELNVFEMNDYRQAIQFSSFLMQQSLAMMQISPMGSSDMSTQSMSQSMPGGQMFGSQSQNTMSQSASGLPDPNIMFNSQAPPAHQPNASQLQPGMAQRQPTTKTESSSTAQAQTSSQSDCTLPVSSQPGEELPKPKNERTEVTPSPPKLQKLHITEPTESAEPDSEFSTPPQSPDIVLAEVAAQGKKNEGGRFFDAADTNRTELEKGLHNIIPHSPEKELLRVVSQPEVKKPELTPKPAPVTPKPDIKAENREPTANSPKPEVKNIDQLSPRTRAKIQKKQKPPSRHARASAASASNDRMQPDPVTEPINDRVPVPNLDVENSPQKIPEETETTKPKSGVEETNIDDLDDENDAEGIHQREKKPRAVGDTIKLFESASGRPVKKETHFGAEGPRESTEQTSGRGRNPPLSGSAKMFQSALNATSRPGNSNQSTPTSSIHLQPPRDDSWRLSGGRPDSLDQPVFGANAAMTTGSQGTGSSTSDGETPEMTNSGQNRLAQSAEAVPDSNGGEKTLNEAESSSNITGEQGGVVPPTTEPQIGENDPSANTPGEGGQHEPNFQSEPGTQHEPGGSQPEPDAQREPGDSQSEPDPQHEPGGSQPEPDAQREPGDSQSEPGTQHEPAGSQHEPAGSQPEPDAQREPNPQGEPGNSEQEPGVERERGTDEDFRNTYLPHDDAAEPGDMDVDESGSSGAAPPGDMDVDEPGSSGAAPPEDLDKVSGKLFEDTLAVMTHLNKLNSGKEATTYNFSKDEESFINKGNSALLKGKKVSDELTENIKRGRQLKYETGMMNKYITDRTNARNNIIKKWFKKAYDLLRTVDPEVAMQYEGSVQYLHMLMREKPSDEPTAKKKDQWPAANQRPDQGRATKKFKVYVASHYGDVQGVTIKFFQPYRYDETCQMEGDSRIWSAEVLMPTQSQHHSLHYRYCIRRADKSEELEWLGREDFNYSLSRYLSVDEISSYGVIYDGAACPKKKHANPGMWQSFKSGVSELLVGDGNRWREQEVTNGFHAMMPMLTEQLFSQRCTADITRDIFEVVNRHRYLRNSYADKQQFKSLFNSYIERIYRWLVDYMEERAHNSSCHAVVSSLLLFLNTWSWNKSDSDPHYTRQSVPSNQIPIEKINKLLLNTHLFLISNPGFHNFTLEDLAKATGTIKDKTFLRILDSLETAMTYKNNYTWMTLVPFVHANMNSRLKQIDQSNPLNPLWWGDSEIMVTYKNSAKSCLNYESWMIWYNWLSPYFYMDKWAARTFLAVLSPRMLSEMITKCDAKTLMLPLDSFTACITYYRDREQKSTRFWEMATQLVINSVHRLIEMETGTEERILIFNVALNSLNMLLEEYIKRHLIREVETIHTIGLILVVLHGYKQITIQTEEKPDETEIFEVQLRELVVSFMRQERSYLTTERIKTWSQIYGCSGHQPEIDSWWEPFITELLGEELQKAHPSSIVDRYLDYDQTNIHISRMLLEYAIQNAGQLLQSDRGLGAYDSRRIAKIINQAVDKTWSGLDERSSTTIVTSVLKWRNFVTLYNFIHGAEGREWQGSDPIHARTVERMTVVISSLHDVIKGLKTREITIQDFNTLKPKITELVEVCDCQEAFLQSEKNHIRNYVDSITQHLEKLVQFKRTIRTFLASCRESLKGTVFSDITRWLDFSEDSTSIRSQFDNQSEVLNPQIAPSFRQAAEDFVEKRDYRLFMNFLKIELNRTKSSDLDGVVDAYKRACKSHQDKLQQISRGDIKADEIRLMKTTVFGGNDTTFKAELNKCLPNKMRERMRQLEICDRMVNYGQAARVVLELKKTFALEGNFDVLNIFQHPKEGVKLNEITDKVSEGAELLGKDITREQIHCLQKLNRYPEFVEWAQKEVPDNEIRTFVDLAHNNIGENDDQATKIDALMDALNGYSSMIYELKTTTPFDGFMRICRKVWQAFEKSPKLPKQLDTAAQELDLWKALKKNLDGFEIDTLSQAKSINANGIFHIGARDAKKPTNRHLVLNDVIDLECTLTRSVVDKATKNVATKAKFSATRVDGQSEYKASLEELQEKLTLLAGEKQRENKDVIEKFDKLRDVVTKLGQAYLDLQREGCILFDDLLIIIRCSDNAKDPIELRFAGAERSLITHKDGKTSVISHSNELHRFMIGCMDEWEETLTKARKEHRILNHYTTEQLVTLRRELAKLSRAAPGDFVEVLRLVRVVAPASKTRLFQLGQAYRSSNRTTEPMDTEQEEDETDVEDLVQQIMEYDDYVEHNQCVFAVKILGTTKPMEEYVEYIQNQMEAGFQDATISSEIFASSTTSTSMMDQLKKAWIRFLDMTSSTHEKLMSIDQLVFTLKGLLPREERRVSRKKPDWLESNKPTLLVCDKDKMLQLVLSVYIEDVDAEKPTRSNILICTKFTTVEEVKIFMLRALSDSDSVYCMVNCERLDNSTCRVIEEQIYQSVEHRVDGYTICFFCDEAVREARIRSYLSKFSVHNIDMIKGDTAEKCRDYIQTKILSGENVQKSVRARDNGLACRVIRSDQAGVGKTLHCTRIHEQNPTANYVIIPIYRKLDIDAIIRQLYERCKPEPYSNIIHIDISYEVESGVDDILMNLIILGSICSSRGVVWHRNERDYYLIESMPFKKLGKNVHHLLDLMPTINCKPPTNEINELTPDTSLDSKILATKEWQIVLKFLQRHEARDGEYKLQSARFTNKTEAMKLIVKHCGLYRPSWAELTYFVSFFSSQLIKVESSPYCSSDNTSNPTGFRKFVVEFMRIMAQDFATRSLKISEESPGLTLNELKARAGGGGVLDMLSVKRSWESANHPYLFFNEDSASFSFIGFVLSDEITDRECYIIDPETGRRLEDYPAFSRQLKNELERNYKVNLSQPFNQYSKDQKLDKMQQIMVKDPHLYRGSSNRITDPDPNYELTLDNVKKILAIHQRIRVNIPVIVMGDTGCGKTKLIDYASKLQVPEELRQIGDGSKANPKEDHKRITNMITVKIHGGTTEDDIIYYVEEAQKVARENREKCEAYARKRGWVSNENGRDTLFNVPSVYTVLFLDEANTTEAIGLVKEVLCDGRMLGKPLDLSSGLKIVAACNPYRKHNEKMIKKLREAGLGYFVGESETTDKFAGHIPMRHLVYRVQALSQSLLPLVWDFGTLKNDVERQYVAQMITRAKNRDLDFGSRTNVVAQIISVTHAFMREQKDECSFVSLRDVNRLLEITRWFQQISPDLLRLMRERMDGENNFHILDDNDSGDELEVDEEHNYMSHTVANSLLLALGVCYLARLEEDTRKRYSEEISPCIRDLLDSDYQQGTITDGAVYFNNLIKRCQDVIIDEVIGEVSQEGLEERGSKAKHTNIAKNKALKENVFMMIVCIENRIPLFLVGKPGSSKSLSKAMVFDALVGRKARSQLIQRFKQTYMVSFQCSRLATPNSIVSVFHEGAKRQQNRDIHDFVSIIVLDEVGLAEDSENMPLKALHPLLEDGCEGHEKPEPWKKCAFIGISNWALDPAKMNRGIFVQRGTPEDVELIDIARGICKGADSKVLDEVNQVLEYLVNGYLAVCKAHKPSSRELTEFFGLRDFYSLVKMVLRFAQFTGHLYKSQIIHAIKRNFGGFDPQYVDCVQVFIEKFPALESWPESNKDKPSTEPMDLVKCSITNDVEALKEIESRYLLVLTENLSILSIIFDKFVSTSSNSPNSKQPEIIFGSYFKRDIHFTQVCHNINLIKNCMASGTPVILLNLDDLYESLYDTLNQYFSTLGDTRFVGLGLGTHRVKAFIHNDFRLVVIADSQKVYKDFPIPLINRLEKHYISMNTLLNEQQKEVKRLLESWAKKFQTPNHQYRKQADQKCYCGTEMYLPYMLPCRAHHIGACCKDKISLGQLPRECPRCRLGKKDEPIPEEWEWEVDRVAKESRDYFEKSSLETNFIGYSNEMIALVVIQSTPDDAEFEIAPDKILEQAKRQLLQVATADSVLRVEKTNLSKEREWVQTIYFQEQNHENLYSYLKETVSQEQSHAAEKVIMTENNEQRTGLFLQVTTFARLLTSIDMDDIQERMTVDEPSFTLEYCTINDFDTESEFTDRLRKFYSECHSYQKCLLVLQCESAHTKLELLDSVRYLVFRESKIIQPTEFENHMVITVLILNLPRGIPLSCYQGKPWKCVHIDDPSCSDLKTPSLLQCLKMKPSEIIQRVIHDAKVQTGLVDTGGDMQQSMMSDGESYSVLSQSPSLAPSSVHPINRTQASMQDDDGIDVIPVPEPVDYGTMVDVQSIIVPALPKVLSAIDGHDQMSYAIIRNMLRNTDPTNITHSVVIVWLEYTQNLLSEFEQRNTRYNWVTSNAAKAVVMKRNETVRSSLETSLHAEIRPALAAVLAQCEPYNNLVLLRDESPIKRKFWLELMKACFITKLNYSDIATSDEKLPERFKVSGDLGGRRFNCKFPFSWIVFEIINDMLKDHPASEAERLFVETPVGLVITKYFEIKESRSEGSFKDWSFGRYISDFIHLSHPCHSNQEHELVCLSMIAMTHKLTNEDNRFNSLVSIHDLFHRYSEYYSKLSIIINVTLRWNLPVILNKEENLLWSAVCSEVLKEQENLVKYPCHLLVLMKTMNLVQKIGMREFKQDFSGYVSIISSLDGLFKDYLLQMNENGDDVGFIPDEFKKAFEKMRTECLIIRHQLILKKNYIQHVVLKLNPGVIDPDKIKTDQLSNISRACIKLTEFKKFDSFYKVVKALEDSLLQQTCDVYKCKRNCLRCKGLMVSPVRLPCNHLVCLECIKSPNLLCPHPGCNSQITESVNYDPSKDKILNKNDVKELEIHRTYLNEFFMMFVSDVVFHPEFENSKHKEPSKEVIDYLVGCITSQNGTRKFSVFNAHDVIDQKSPVVRTFLLKLLLHVALREDYEYNPEDEDERTDFVAASKLIEFINKPTDRTYAQLRAQTIALLIDCIKDHLQETEKFVNYGSPDTTMEDVIGQFEDADWFEEVKTLNLNHLKCTARTHIILERVMWYILSTDEQNSELLVSLNTYLDRFETVSEQPKLFICRLVYDQFGEGKIQDIKHNKDLSFLLPKCIHRALLQFKFEDHLAIEADRSYKTVIDIIDRVLTIREEQLDGPKNELSQVSSIPVLLHALFTRVARYFTTQHRPNENRINEIRELLQRKLTQHRESQLWFESILRNNVLGGSLPLESSEGVQISMLALRTFTTLREGQGLLAPLTNILNNVSSCRKLFLPTMPDNPIEEIQATVSKVLSATGDVATAYTCPNGHVYYIGNCGKPYTKGKCNVCKADIGGAGHTASTGNTAVQNIQQYKTLPGYLEDAAVMDPVAERDLNVLSLTVMRCLLHVCLLTASTTSKEQVKEVIGKGENSIGHLITQIKADVKRLSDSLRTNQERIMILLHLTLHRMSQINFGSQYSLTDKTSRRIWEADFDNRIIKQVFNQGAVGSAERQQQLISDNVGEMKTIIVPKPDLIKQSMLDCSYMWIYKRALNLEVIRKAVSTQKNSLIKQFLNQGTQLQLVSNLPEIVTLIKRLSVKFDNKFTQEQSESSKIESFLLQYEEFRELVDKYISVWNVYTKLHNDEESEESAHIFPITYQSSLLEVLPITVSPDNPNGSTYKRILYYLIETHNSFIHRSQTIEEGIDVSLVTQSHLVCLPGGSEELVPIVTRHSQYEFGDSFERNGDWDKVNEDIGYQYITGRRPINTESINKLPAYHFPNEFTIITLINKLRDQELVNRGDKETVMQRLSGYGVNQLSGILTHLETMVKICSTIRQYDNTEKLHSTIQRNFDEKPDWLIESLEVRHLVSLWTVVKFLQAKAFKKNQQLAFDEIVGECKKDLDDCYKVEMMERMASFKSYQTNLLLEHLFEFILFKLNNVTARNEELLFHQPLSDCMDQHILEVYEDEEEGQHYERLKVIYQDENTPQIPVSQATSAWEYLYLLYSTPVETELAQ